MYIPYLYTKPWKINLSIIQERKIPILYKERLERLEQVIFLPRIHRSVYSKLIWAADPFAPVVGSMACHFAWARRTHLSWPAGQCWDEQSIRAKCNRPGTGRGDQGQCRRMPACSWAWSDREVRVGFVGWQDEWRIEWVPIGGTRWQSPGQGGSFRWPSRWRVVWGCACCQMLNRVTKKIDWD